MKTLLHIVDVILIFLLIGVTVGFSFLVLNGNARALYIYKEVYELLAELNLSDIEKNINKTENKFSNSDITLSPNADLRKNESFEIKEPEKQIVEDNLNIVDEEYLLDCNQPAKLKREFEDYLNNNYKAEKIIQICSDLSGRQLGVSLHSGYPVLQTTNDVEFHQDGRVITFKIQIDVFKVYQDEYSYWRGTYSNGVLEANSNFKVSGLSESICDINAKIVADFSPKVTVSIKSSQRYRHFYTVGGAEGIISGNERCTYSDGDVSSDSFEDSISWSGDFPDAW